MRERWIYGEQTFARHVTHVKIVSSRIGPIAVHPDQSDTCQIGNVEYEGRGDPLVALVPEQVVIMIYGYITLMRVNLAR